MLSTIQTFITALTLEAFLAGVYFASFLLCLRWLIFSDDGGTLRKPIHRPFLIITLILFAFSVTALSAGLKKTLSFSSAATHVVPMTINVCNRRIGLLSMG